MSKILITGNGFDLFHHLPTKYHHFISIMETIEKFQPSKEATFEDLFGRIFKDKYLDDYNSIVENYNVEQIKFDNSKIQEIDKLLKENLWYKHFKNVSEIETWIDFEIEIENILNQLSVFDKLKDKNEIKRNKFVDEFIGFTDFELFDVISVFNPVGGGFKLNVKYINQRNGSIDIKKILEDLAKSFENFILIFNRFLADIISIFYAEIKKKSIIPFHLMNEIFTFNYTPTLEKIYNINKSKVNYLHGEINEDNTLQNIVLGISEIPDNIKTSNFFDFTKYYQKINKNSNKKFIEIPSKNQGYNEETFFYVIGHSLDKSDKEYVLDLFKFLENDVLDKSRVCIFYYDDNDRERKIRNLLSVEDEKIVSKMHRQDRLCFIELNEENIKKEFEKQTYKHYIDIR